MSENNETVTDDEVEETYAQHWRDLVEPDGRLDLGSVKRELYDYWQLLSEVPKVYDHVTGGLISKPNTTAHHVIAAADDLQMRLDNEDADELARLRALAAKVDEMALPVNRPSHWCDKPYADGWNQCLDWLRGTPEVEA